MSHAILAASQPGTRTTSSASRAPRDGYHRDFTIGITAGTFYGRHLSRNANTQSWNSQTVEKLDLNMSRGGANMGTLDGKNPAVRQRGSQRRRSGAAPPEGACQWDHRRNQPLNRPNRQPGVQAHQSQLELLPVEGAGTSPSQGPCARGRSGPALWTDDAARARSAARRRCWTRGEKGRARQRFFPGVHMPMPECLPHRRQRNGLVRWIHCPAAAEAWTHVPPRLYDSRQCMVHFRRYQWPLGRRVGKGGLGEFSNVYCQRVE